MILTPEKFVKDRDELATVFPRQGIGAELGVQHGDYAEVLLRNADPAKLFLIDAWRHLKTGTVYDLDPANVQDSEQDKIYRRVLHRFRPHVLSGRVVIIRDLIMPLMLLFENNSLDWVYVDAAHDYEQVLLNLAASYRVVKPGGLIAGHDYKEYGPEWSFIQVVPAVNKFLETHPDCKLEYLSQDPSPYPSSYGIRKR